MLLKPKDIKYYRRTEYHLKRFAFGLTYFIDNHTNPIMGSNYSILQLKCTEMSMPLHSLISVKKNMLFWNLSHWKQMLTKRRIEQMLQRPETSLTVIRGWGPLWFQSFSTTKHSWNILKKAKRQHMCQMFVSNNSQVYC